LCSHYPAPLLPLPALPCALGLARLPKVGMVLGLYSILITTVAKVTNASPPASYYNPLAKLHPPLLWSRDLVASLGQFLGLRASAAAALLLSLILAGGTWEVRDKGILGRGLSIYYLYTIPTLAISARRWFDVGSIDESAELTC